MSTTEIPNSEIPNSTVTPESNSSDNGHDLLALKRLLLGPEQQRLQALEEQLSRDPLGIDQLSQILPVAVERASSRDDHLAQSLAPTLTRSFHETIQRDPQSLVDVIFPIIGPAIRRSIKEAIAGLIQSMNHTLESSLSWQGLRWRWEAWRTGRSFGEVVLLRTLLYRVTDVLLFHNHDGLLLQHVSSLREPHLDAQVVPGMLTAIQDFVRDSFGSDRQGGLQKAVVDDKDVWVEQGPRATLALVIEGHPPQTLRTQMQQVLESVHQRWQAELMHFTGDNTSFAATCPLLQELLQSVQREQQSSLMARLLARVILWGLLLGLAALAIWGGYRFWSWRQEHYQRQIRHMLRVPAGVQLQFRGSQLVLAGRAHREWLDFAAERARYLPGVAHADFSQVEDLDESWYRYLKSLEGLPGIVVIRSEVAGDGYKLTGWRDPLAADPDELLRRSGLDPDKVHATWYPFRSWDPAFRWKRALLLIDPPATVQAEFVGDAMVLSGMAKHRWLVEAQQRARGIADVIQVDFSQVRDIDQEALDTHIPEIESLRFRYSGNQTELDPPGIRQASEIGLKIARAAEAAAELNLAFRVAIVGTLSNVQSEDQLRDLTYTRARWISYYLVQGGAPQDAIVVAAHRPDFSPEAPVKKDFDELRLDVQVTPR